MSTPNVACLHFSYISVEAECCVSEELGNALVNLKESTILVYLIECSLNKKGMREGGIHSFNGY